MQHVPDERYLPEVGMRVRQCTHHVRFELVESGDPADMFDHIDAGDIALARQERRKQKIINRFHNLLSRTNHLQDVDHLAAAAKYLGVWNGVADAVREADQRIWKRYGNGVGMRCDRRQVWVSAHKGPRGEHPRTLEKAGFRVLGG